MSDFPVYEVDRDHYQISTDASRLDIDVIHGYLERSYWSPGIPKESVARALPYSLCFGLYATDSADASDQIGFARVVTDYASFAYLADVFVLPSEQGNGLGTWLIESIMNYPHFDGIRSFFLATRDAHDLYAKFGFEVPENPSKLMMKRYDMPWRNLALAETHAEIYND